jgi:lysophospholipase L1-like esterase
MVFVDPDTGETVLYRTNSQGWKDIEHTFRKDPHTVRILVIGDSNTYGSAKFEDLYTRRLQELLDRVVPTTEVISIGVGGWGTDQELEVLKLEGVRYQPDFVILQFCSNDIFDNLAPTSTTHPSSPKWQKTFKYLLRDGQLVRQKLQPHRAETETMKHVLYRSALVRALHRASIVWRRLSKSGLPPEVGAYARTAAPESPQYIYSTLGQESSTVLEAWALFEKLVAEMKAVSNSVGAQLLIFSEEVEEGRRAFLRRWLPIESHSDRDFFSAGGKEVPVNWSTPMHHLQDIADRLGVPLIPHRRVYDRYVTNIHPNGAGNMAMAEDIRDFLLGWEPFRKRAKLSASIRRSSISLPTIASAGSLL